MTSLEHSLYKFFQREYVVDERTPWFMIYHSLAETLGSKMYQL